MKRILTITLLFLLIASAAAAKNIDLVTLPDRDGVQLTIYNSADITLVREIREITLKKGMNRLQFSWHGTLIDPTSVEFRPLTHKDSVDVSHTAFPGQKPKHLIWHVKSAYEGQVRVEVTYFTSGLTWRMDYVSVTDLSERKMDFSGYVRVFNRSGEEYTKAKVRLIVGKINLVEKVANLARRSGYKGNLPATVRREFKKRALRDSFRMAEKSSRFSGGSYYRKKIVKEGLSEYFMFTIPGRETLKNGWSKRLRAVNAEKISFDTVYRLRTHQYGAFPVRFFIWKNDAKHRLGGSPLPNGQVRIFRRNGRDGLSYLGQQLLRYVPVRAKIEVNLGRDPRVIFRLKRIRVKRGDFRYYKSRYSRKERVTGWNTTSWWKASLRNYRGKAIRFEWQQRWGGDVTFLSSRKVKLFDYRTVSMKIKSGSNSRLDITFRTVYRMGKNRKQNRVTLED